MKLEALTKDHFVRAALQIDHHGIPDNSIFNNYWVVIDGTEYPFLHLCRMAFEIAFNRALEDFTTGNSYLNHVRSLGFEIIYYKEGISPISNKELDFYSTVAGTKYRSTADEDIRRGEVLKTLVRKVNKWAELSVIDNFTYEKDNHWQWSGTFKSYLWIRIRRPKDSRLVYFIVSCDEKGDLVVEIDCQHSNHSEGSKKVLKPEVVKAFYEHRDGPEYRQLIIPKAQVGALGWDALVEQTQSYMTEFASLYDELEALVNEDEMPKSTTVFGLKLHDAPARTKSYAQNEKTFQGVRINWERKLSGSKALGIAGEELVKSHEIAKLKAEKLYDLAEKVSQKMDGEGYDILSFDKSGQEVNIEVKTTVKGIDEPFYMSLNERKYLEKNPKNYLLYRLYNYNFHSKMASFYVLSGQDLLRVLFTATTFEVSINNESK